MRLTGQLADAPVFPDFDYRSFLNRQDIVATMSRPAVEVLDAPPDLDIPADVTRVRLALDHSLQRALPEPEASLAGGIAFGRDGNLPAGLYDDFRDAGLAHIVAVSGSNVSLVAALTFAVFTWLIGRRWAFIPVGVSVLGYLFIAGLSASVVRAGIMAGVYLFGAYLGRQRSSLSALAAAAIVMTAYQPSAALDLGFQLSLAATAGLIVFGPWIRFSIEAAAARLGVVRVPGLLVQVTSLSLAASLATMPIAWVNFGRISVISPFTNIVVEPVFLVAFWLSVLTAAAGLVWHPAGWAVGLAAYYPLSFTTWFARHSASLPFAAVDVPRGSGTLALLSYLAMGSVGWFAYRRFPPNLPPRGIQRAPGRVRLLQGAVGMTALAAAIVPVSLLPLRSPGETTFALLDTDGTSTLLVTTPHGQRILVNAGPTSIVVARELGAVLPHWERTIDAAIILGPDADESGGLAALGRRYSINRIIDETTADVAATVIDGASFTAIHSSASSAAQVVAVRIAVGSTSVTMPADQSFGGLRPAELAPSDVLVVPDNASQPSDIPFIHAVTPEVALIPVGTGNFDSPPSQAVLDALSGALTFRTDQDGRVTLHTDGDAITFATSK